MTTKLLSSILALAIFVYFAPASAAPPIPNDTGSYENLVDQAAAKKKKKKKAKKKKKGKKKGKKQADASGSAA